MPNDVPRRSSTYFAPARPTESGSIADTGLQRSIVTPSMMESASDLDWNWDYDLMDQSSSAQADWLRLHDVPFDYNNPPADNTIAVMDAGAPRAQSHSNMSDISEPEPTMVRERSGLHSIMGTQRNSSDATFLDQSWDFATGQPQSLTHATSEPADAQMLDMNALMQLDTYPEPFDFADATISHAGRGIILGSTSTSAAPGSSVDSVSTAPASSRTDESSRITTPASTSSPSDNASPSMVKSAPRVLSHKDLLPIISGYPRLMLQDDYRSPFVHHKLYQDSHSDMTVMSKSRMAICCASAHRNKSSAQFVSKAVAAERERLIHDFVSLCSPNVPLTLPLVCKIRCLTFL